MSHMFFKLWIRYFLEIIYLIIVNYRSDPEIAVNKETEDSTGKTSVINYSLYYYPLSKYLLKILYYFISEILRCKSAFQNP